MASKVSLAIRREEAWKTIHQLIAVLSDQADLTGGYFLFHNKDQEVQQVLEVEEFARFLSDLSTSLSILEEPTPSPRPVVPSAVPTARVKR